MSTVTPLPPVTGDHLLLADLYHGDFSNDNPNSIQFHDLVNAGIAGVILKAGQSVASNDPVFHNCWARAKAAGLKRGAYLFFDPNANPRAQADHLMSLATLENGDIPFVLDVETAGANVGANAYIAAQRIKAKTGFWPWIYSGDSFYQDNLKAHFPEDLHTLWIARYGPHSPKTKCAMWQYTDSARVPGIPHALDMSVYFGNMESLNARCVRPL
jgi:lysozyme